MLGRRRERSSARENPSSNSLRKGATKERLLAPDLVAEFMTAMPDELASVRRERKASDAERTRNLGEIDRKISGMMRAIEDGLYDPSMKDRLKALQNDRRALDVDVGEAAESELTILSHPNLPERRFLRGRTGRRRWT